MNELSIDPLIIMQLLSLFLIGALLVKLRWIHDIEKNQKQWMILAESGIMIGLISKLPGLIINDAGISYFSYMAGGPVFGIGMIGTFILIFQRMNGSGLMKWWIYPGRTALTNYLSQSLIMTYIYYGYGLEQFQEIGVAEGMILVMVLFIIQVMISKLWLKYFKMGPVEWLWRAGTYLN